ncbi:hypothetical protein [Xenorhabdus hominickii]|uniref:Uncharacterized protein n=1 Tax=Xenorhabdus hominickii TaxID=351679 RepID=A0A2G0QBC5_XENHO|nr:hypothetical protein [Xenorhabdus hominickii]AOM40531.1 hypothetical protein A9255_07995 [Xenorhabdus hominickii]PHM56523.1 hypothetical protein Xhom_02016 [Xenorhabdus hominickii]
MPKHIHADLMMKQAELALITDKPGLYFQVKVNDEWDDIISHQVNFDIYRKYRLKPRTIKIGEIDVPEPVKEPLEYGAEYYAVHVTGLMIASGPIMWEGTIYDLSSLARGFVHLDLESAVLHAKALISLTQKKENSYG